MAADERVQERERKGDDMGSRLQASACSLPEGSLGKVFAPEDLPARDGPPVGTEALGELTDSARCRPLPHGADEDDDGAQVHFSAKEANGGRSDSLPATVALTAKAEPDSLWLW